MTVDIESDEIISPGTSHVAFVGAVRWVLVLGAEVARANGGHVPPTAADAIVDTAWAAFDGMAGAELDAGLPVGGLARVRWLICRAAVSERLVRDLPQVRQSWR